MRKVEVWLGKEKHKVIRANSISEWRKILKVKINGEELKPTPQTINVDIDVGLTIYPHRPRRYGNDKLIIYRPDISKPEVMNGVNVNIDWTPKSWRVS